MLYKLHYFFESAGANALGILLGVYMAEYTDASQAEIGLLYMLRPFASMIFSPIICSLADRKQAHRSCLIWCELAASISIMPFIVVPFLGPGVYKAHARFCWYCLVSFKVIGDIALESCFSICNSLTVNYAKRIGTEFSTYRVWATVSWMLFGFITGHLNEIWFFPKYVAAFMILVLVTLLDALVCFLWPREYFRMMTPSEMERERQQLEARAGGHRTTGSSLQTRSLMPKELVWAHAKKQLWSLVTFRCSLEPDESDSNETEGQLAGDTADGKRPPEARAQKNPDPSISERAQWQTLLLLMRRDPRIALYLLMFVVAGALDVPVGFFIMSLSDRCHAQHSCDFSTLTGYLQISMASVESLLFVHINTITLTLGRLNTLTLAFALALVKFLFYATIWPRVDPHWSLVSEMSTGAIYGTFLAIQVETGHLFASQVEHLIPELLKRGVIDADDEASRERLKLSLSATMQALLASASDGLGRGLGALVFGLIIDAYSYETLWLFIALLSLCTLLALQTAAMFEHCCHVKLGLDHLVDSAKQTNSQLNSCDQTNGSGNGFQTRQRFDNGV